MSAPSTPTPPTQGAVPRPAAIYDPVARSLDVIGDRWSLVLVRQLLLGPKGFQELRMRTGIAPRVLSSRLKDLVTPFAPHHPTPQIVRPCCEARTSVL